MRPSSIVRAPFVIGRHLWMLVVTYMPGWLGNDLRLRHYRRRFKRCGRNVTIDQGVLIDGAELISVGDDVHIDKNCIIATGSTLTGKIHRKPNPAFGFSEGELVIGDHVHIVQQCILMAYGGLHIGDHCTLSAGTKVYSLTNTPYDPDDRERVVSIMPYSQAPFLAGPVVLDRNVWVGLNGILMPGTHLRENSFVVSNSLVMGTFEPNSYIQGQPARRVRARYAAAG